MKKQKEKHQDTELDYLESIDHSLGRIREHLQFYTIVLIFTIAISLIFLFFGNNIF